MTGFGKSGRDPRGCETDTFGREFLRPGCTWEERLQAARVREARRLEDLAWRTLRRSRHTPAAALNRRMFELWRERRQLIDGSGSKFARVVRTVRRSREGSFAEELRRLRMLEALPCFGCERPPHATPCPKCGNLSEFGHGAEIYNCARCECACCTACTVEGPKNTVLCDDCAPRAMAE